MMNKRDYKLDVLKALAIVLVLIWHLQPIRIGLDGTAALTAKMSKIILGLIYSKTLVAVPIFYFVSLLLFFKKYHISNQYLLQRIKKLINIFSFWFFVQLSCYFIVKQVAIFLNLQVEFSPNNSKLWWMLIMGGPSLPGVGDSVFYFISNLILLVIFSFYYNKFSTTKIDVIFFIIFSIYLWAHQFFYAIPYWRIDNFLIYSPIAHFMVSKQNSKILPKKYLHWSFGIYISFSIYEIIVHKLFHVAHSAYDINSLQWGVIWIYVLITLYNFPKKLFIKWLSKYSLGLFAIHKFFLLIFLFAFSSIQQVNKLKLSVDGCIIHYKYIFSALCTILFCILTIKLFSSIKPLKQYIA